MPDITMCSSKTCIDRESCYRWKAKPNYYQSYADFTTASCDHYIHIRSEQWRKR